MAMFDSGRLMDDDSSAGGSRQQKKYKITVKPENDEIKQELVMLKKQVTSIEERLVMMQRSLQEITTIVRNIQAAGLRAQTHSKRDNDDYDLI